jgi:hypothetical protein
MMIWLKSPGSSIFYMIVFDDRQFHSINLLQIVCQIVGKRIIIIDQKDFHVREFSLP